MLSISPRRHLQLEGLLIFGAFPLALSLLKPHGWMYVTLWIAAALSWRGLRRHGVTWKSEWNAAALSRNTTKTIILRFIPYSIALMIFTWLAIPEHFFGLPRERPKTWVMVMIFYPLLSAIPQEIIFRSYFFRRFSILFPNALSIQTASALAFGWVHILLQNWVAVVFSAIGGYLFANTYGKTRSLAAVCFEHALYGCYIFTLGLGFYFYHGQAVH
jgi:membrane protease YdiL (CAAX protease family)